MRLFSISGKAGWGPFDCFIDFVLTGRNLEMAALSSLKPTDLLNLSSSVRSPCDVELVSGETAWLTV